MLFQTNTVKSLHNWKKLLTLLFVEINETQDVLCINPFTHHTGEWIIYYPFVIRGEHRLSLFQVYNEDYKSHIPPHAGMLHF